MKNLSVLVTGGCGFIGSNIVEYLLNNGVKQLRIIDNLSTGNLKNIEPLFKQFSNLEFLYGDISNLEMCRKAVKGMDVITHQAALGSVPRSIDDPLSSHISNVNGFLNILIAAKEEGIKRIVYASSSSVYGDHPDLPKKEENTGNVLSPYAATKAIDEIYANVFTRCYNMECIGLRYFNVFGPRQSPNGAYAAVIPKFIDLMKNGKQPVINGDGTYSRDFTYVDNVVQANILGLTTCNNECFGEAFNIGAGGQTNLSALVDAINNGLKSNIKPMLGSNRPGDIPHSNADVSKAQRMLGYNPMIKFDEGILKTITYFDKITNNLDRKLTINDIDFNQLLNRQPIEVDNEIVTNYLHDKKILITGGCGSIGSEVLRQLLNIGINNIIVYDNSELGIFSIKNEINKKYKENCVKFILGDVIDYNHVKNVFEEHLPNFIFHCAAYKHVNIVEEFPQEAIRVNIIGSKNVADIALKCNVEKFIFVSTDKAVNPTSIMGTSKRIAEIYINYLNKESKTQFITTRFGNVLGSSGSVIPTFIDNINNNESIKITHPEIIRYFMTIPEAAKLILQACVIGNKGEILLFDMGKPIKIYDLAMNMIEKYSNKKIDIVFTQLNKGEKLYEELLCKHENVLPTENPLIMRLKHSDEIDYYLFFEKFNKLILNNYSNIEISQLFKEIVNEYNLNNN